MVPTWNLAVTRLVTQCLEQKKKIPPYRGIFSESARRVAPIYQIWADRNTPPIPYQTTSYKPCNIWYGIGGVLRFAHIWYIGPPRRSDTENVPL